jgi:hypothetical protein
MKKAGRMEKLIQEITGSNADSNPWPAAYTAYFLCFNSAEYYEAHDVLEHLWLQTSGPEHRFFKGLIQFAGAFVHLRKQYLRPHHHKDGRRLAPAARLFTIALLNWKDQQKYTWGLDLDVPRSLCREYLAVLEGSSFAINPWRPENAPQLLPNMAESATQIAPLPEA